MKLLVAVFVGVAVAICVHVESKPAKPALDVRAVQQGLQRIMASGGIECSACKFVMGEICAELQKNSTVQKLLAGLEGLCKDLPDVQDCTNFFTQYGYQVLDIAVQLVTPQLVCDFAGACNGTSTAVERLTHAQSEVPNWLAQRKLK